jgi:hypothetical protein
MSRLVSRILLSIFMFPLAGIFYIFTMVAGEEMMRNANAPYASREMTLFLICGSLTWIIVAIYWCLLWRTGVVWNSYRITSTVIAAIGAVFVGGLCGGLAGGILGNREGESFGAFIASILSIVLWLIATVFIWRETTAERSARAKSSTKTAVTCPTCGYNLTGLSESRCPECGAKFTLDELIGLQKHNEVEME